MRIFFSIIFFLVIGTLQSQDSKSLAHWSYVKMIHNPSMMFYQKPQYTLVLKSRIGDKQLNSVTAAIGSVGTGSFLGGANGLILNYEKESLKNIRFLEFDQNILAKYCYRMNSLVLSGNYRVYLGVSLGILNHKQVSDIIGENITHSSFNGDVGISFSSRTASLGLSLENFTNKTGVLQYTRSLTALGSYQYLLNPDIDLMPSLRYSYQFLGHRNRIVGCLVIRYKQTLNLGVNYNSLYNTVSPLIGFHTNGISISLAYDLYLRKADESNEKNIEALIRYR